MFSRKAMLPFGPHQAPLYRGSRQNRVIGKEWSLHPPRPARLSRCETEHLSRSTRWLSQLFRFAMWLGRIFLRNSSATFRSCFLLESHQFNCVAGELTPDAWQFSVHRRIHYYHAYHTACFEEIFGLKWAKRLVHYP